MLGMNPAFSDCRRAGLGDKIMALRRHGSQEAKRELEAPGADRAVTRPPESSGPRRRLLQRLRQAWLDFQDSYAGLPRSQLLQPGVTGAWSVRDILAHVTTWEEEALRHLPLILQGAKPPRYSVWYGGIDAFNALMTDRKKDLPFREVLRQQQETHRRLIAFLERAPEEQLRSGTRFRRRLRLDTYGHYPIHAAAIRKWRASRGLRAAQAASTKRRFILSS